MTDQPSDLQVRSEETTNKQGPTKQGTLDNSTATKKSAVLAARAAQLTVTAAARTVGVDRTTVYVWRKNDPDFAAALDEAKTEAVEVLEESVYERAFKDPILAMFVVKAHKPEYNDKVQAARAFAEASHNSPARQEALEWAGLVREERLLRAAQRAQLQAQVRAEQDARIIEGQALPLANSGEASNRAQPEQHAAPA